jgi:anti-sigma factor RsiW
MRTRSFGHEDIHAYVDGRLDPAQRRDVAAWLTVCAEAGMRATFYARLNEMLHRRYDAILQEPIPAAWLRRLASPRRPPAGPSSWT